MIFIIILNVTFSFAVVEGPISNIIPGFNLFYDLNDNSKAILLTTATSAANIQDNYNFGTQWLESSVCEVNNLFPSTEVKSNLFSSGSKSTVITSLKEGTSSVPTQTLGNNILQNNLWMESSVEYFLYKGGAPLTGTVDNIILSNSIYLTNDGADNDLSLSVPTYYTEENILRDFGPGNYELRAVVTPIDLKCDFNAPFGTLEEGSDYQKSAEIIIDSSSFQGLACSVNEDYVLGVGCVLQDVDFDLVANAIDNCPFVPNPLQEDTYGDPNIGDACEVFKEIQVVPNSLKFNPNLAEGVCYIDNSGSGNGNLQVHLSLEDAPFSSLQFWKTDQSSFILIDTQTLAPGIENYHFRDINTNSPAIYRVVSPASQQPLLECRVEYVKPYRGTYLVEETQGPNTFYSYQDNLTSEYFLLNGTDELFYKQDSTIGTTVNVNNPTTQNTIKIIKDGVEISNEPIDPKLIALKLHNVRNLRDEAHATTELDKITTLMSKFNITKELTLRETNNCYEGAFGDGSTETYTPYNLTDPCSTEDYLKQRTTVKISIQGAREGNLTVYQIIPKSSAASVDQISFINDGGAQRFIKDKDPIIGWYFNETEGDEEIEYEIPGNSSDGGIIITQEPILYNEGELIINYRQDGCSDGEAYLFDLDDLEASKVYTQNTSGTVYSVCVAHITEDLKANADDNEIYILNYDNASNVSLNTFKAYSTYISTTNTDVYWNMEIQEDNPSGNFSCLGSIDNEDSSLFGDCDYNPSMRIWLHLGVDLAPPTTTLSYSYVAHTIPVTLDAVESSQGSGVESISYCIDDTNTCDPRSDGVTVLGDTTSFPVTCDTSWGCIKFVRFSAKDNSGNEEPTNSEALKMLDEGSACQADCSAVPTPARYLKECNNLNSCDYYNYDDTGTYDNGLHVSNICDLLVVGSYAKYNSTHEIQCPAGPFRLTRFVDETLDVYESSCELLHTQAYPVLIEGESVLLKIISCLDE